MKKEKKNKEIKNNNFKFIFILLIIVIIGGVIFILFNNKDTNNNNDNISNNNNEEKDEYNVNNILFTDINCEFDGNYSLLTYKIINKRNEVVDLSNYEIIVRDKDDNILANIAPSITNKLMPGEEFDTGNAIDNNLCNLYDSLELVIE